VGPPSSAFTVGTSWTNAGTFTHSGGTVTLDGGVGGNIITGGTGTGKDFNNLTTNGAGTWTIITNDLKVLTNLTVALGTLTNSGATNNQTVNGSVTGAGTITMTGGLFTQRVAANQNFGTTSGSNTWTFSNLTFSNSSATARTITTQTGGTGNIVVTGILNVGAVGDSATTTLNAGNRLWILSASGTPLVFNVSSLLAGNTSTFRYTGNGATNITASTGYNNLQIFPGGASVTHTFAAGTFTMTGNLDLGGNSNATGTVVTAGTNNPIINVAGNLTVCALTCSNQMTYIKGTNTIIMNPDGTQTWADNNPTTKQDVGTVSIASGSNSPIIQLITSVKATYVNLGTSHTLDANGSNKLTLTGTANTFFVANGLFIPSTGTVEYQPTATSTVSVANTTYHHVIFDGSLGAGTSTFLLTSGGITTDTINGCGDVTIQDKSALDVTTAAYPMSVGGSWTVNTGGTFNARTGTVTFTNVAACGAKVIGGAVPMTGSNKFNNLTFNGTGGAWSFAGNSVDAGGNFTISAGTVTAPGTGDMLTVNGNWTNTGGVGSFVHNSGLVKIVPALAGTALISGTTTFYDFTSDSGDRTLMFQTVGAPVFTFTNTVVMTGTAGHLLNIRSDDDDGSPTTWKAHFVGDKTGTYLDVKNSGCNAGTSNINLDTNTVNSGNNEYCWVFSAGGVTPPNSPTALVQKRVTAGSVIPVGGWTNENAVDFFATVSDPLSLNVALCVEAKPIGTAFANTENACGSTVITGTTATVQLTGLTNGVEYHWQARTRNSSGTYSLLWVSYPALPDSPNLDAPLPAARDFGIDTTQPVAGAAARDLYNTDALNGTTDRDQNGDGSLDELSANWDAFTDSFSGLSLYQYSIGTTAGGTEIKDWTNNAFTLNARISGLSGVAGHLKTGQQYYFNVRAVDVAGNTSAVQSTNGQHVSPTLTFTISSGSTVVFGDLNDINNYLDRQTTVLQTSTNSYNGYVVKARKTGPLSFNSNTIADFEGGTYASPGPWSDIQCVDGTNCGFGYTSSDTTIAGINKFAGGTLFAPFSSTAPGDVVADNTSAVSGSPISGESFTITNKVSVSPTQAAGRYITSILYTIIPQY
jgi:hypothetical protein